MDEDEREYDENDSEAWETEQVFQDGVIERQDSTGDERLFTVVFDDTTSETGCEVYNNLTLDEAVKLVPYLGEMLRADNFYSLEYVTDDPMAIRVKRENQR